MDIKNYQHPPLDQIKKELHPQDIADKIMMEVSEENLRPFLQEIENIIGTRLEGLWKEAANQAMHRQNIFSKFSPSVPQTSTYKT